MKSFRIILKAVTALFLILSASQISFAVEPFLSLSLPKNLPVKSVSIGKNCELETGLYYFRNRYYSPDLGRFISTDPLDYVDGMNLYAMCNGNYTNLVDPMGTQEGLALALNNIYSEWTDEERSRYSEGRTEEAEAFTEGSWNATRDIGGVYLSETAGVAKFTGIDYLGKKITGRSLSEGIKGISRNIAVDEGVKQEGIEIGEKTGVVLTAGALIATPYASGVTNSFAAFATLSKQSKAGIALAQSTAFLDESFDLSLESMTDADRLRKTSIAGLVSWVGKACYSTKNMKLFKSNNLEIFSSRILDAVIGESVSSGYDMINRPLTGKETHSPEHYMVRMMNAAIKGLVYAGVESVTGGPLSRAYRLSQYNAQIDGKFIFNKVTRDALKKASKIYWENTIAPWIGWGASEGYKYATKNYVEKKAIQ